jgi:preprotein translocase subunit SecG
MFVFLLVVQIFVSLGIITLVMLQQGKGANMGAGFGAGASGTVFGARGSGSFFTRATAVLAAVFFLNCLLIASPLVRDRGAGQDSIARQLEQQAKQQQAEEAAANVEVVEKVQGEADNVPADVPAIGTPAAPADVPAAETPAAPADVPVAETPAVPADVPEVPATSAGTGDVPE